MHVELDVGTGSCAVTQLLLLNYLNLLGLQVARFPFDGGPRDPLLARDLVLARSGCITFASGKDGFLVRLLDQLTSYVLLVAEHVLVRWDRRCIRQHHLLKSGGRLGPAFRCRFSFGDPFQLLVVSSGSGLWLLFLCWHVFR